MPPQVKPVDHPQLFEASQVDPAIEVPQAELAPAEQRTGDERAAFGRFLKTALYDISGEHDLESLTEEEKAWMTPRHLADNLFGRTREDRSVVDRVALNGYEYKLVARSPTKLAETAFTNTIATDDVTENNLARGIRSSVHALKGKLPKMIDHREALRERRKDVKTLHRSAEMPGYAHKTDEAMRQLINSAWQEFVNILDAVHIQRDWSDVQRNRAESALISYLTEGPQRSRTKHWKQMLDLATSYLDNRVGIFSRKIKDTKHIIEVLTINDIDEII